MFVLFFLLHLVEIMHGKGQSFHGAFLFIVQQLERDQRLFVKVFAVSFILLGPSFFWITSGTINI